MLTRCQRYSKRFRDAYSACAAVLWPQHRVSEDRQAPSSAIVLTEGGTRDQYSLLRSESLVTVSVSDGILHCVENSGIRPAHVQRSAR